MATRKPTPPAPSDQPLVPPRGPLLDILATAAYLGVNERNVRRIVAERRAPFVKLGAKVMFHKDDLDDYIASRTVPAKVVIR